MYFACFPCKYVLREPYTLQYLSVSPCFNVGVNFFLNYFVFFSLLGSFCLTALFFLVLVFDRTIDMFVSL